MRVAVVGSGAAGFAATRALIERGCSVTVLDVGEKLDAERQKVVDYLHSTDSREWPERELRQITENPTIHTAKVPRKLVFGSDFIYAKSRPDWRIDQQVGNPCATFAFGGFTQAWGGAMLPAHDGDLQDWPVRRSQLESSFRRAMERLPLSASDSGNLGVDFPTFKNDPIPLRLSAQLQRLLDDVARSPERRGSLRDVRFGQARLAVRAQPSASGEGCVYCGLCITGCPKGAVFQTSDEFAPLIAQGMVDYRRGVTVQKVEEAQDSVAVHYTREDGSWGSSTFDRVLVAAGAVNSTRIMLHSLRRYDEPLQLKDSQKFVVPFLRFFGDDIEWPDINTFAGLFLESRLPALSDRWIHAQISGTNDYILRRFGVDPFNRKSLRGRLLNPLMSRIMIAWCSLHSDHSDTLDISLRSSPDEATPVLVVTPRNNDTTKANIRKVAGALMRQGLAWRCAFVPPATSVSSAGSTGHIGGTFPMRANPSRWNDTDIWGRPAGHKRVHMVDAAVLPSIPATTLLLNIMANADRIASTLPLED